MRPVFTERQPGMAGSFADLGFLEGVSLGTRASEASDASIGGSGLTGE